jgi:hypothetical protein
MMSGYTRLLKICNYLIGTFYIAPDIAQLTCQFLHSLPYARSNELYKNQGYKITLSLASISQNDEISPLGGFNYPCKGICLGLQNALADFK